MTPNNIRETSCLTVSERTSENLPSIGNLRENSEQEEPSFYSAFARRFQTHCNAIKKSKLPIYLFMSIYVFICLLGNVVTGIFWFKNHGIIDKEQEARDILDNSTLFELDWNETKIPDLSLELNYEEFDFEELNMNLKNMTDAYEEEFVNLIGFAINKSISEVSSRSRLDI
jgi:hypothetical protein